MPQREEMSGMEKIGKSLPIFRSDMLPGKLPDGDGVERFRIPQERSRSIGREEPADAMLRVDESHLQIQATKGGQMLFRFFHKIVF